MKKSSAEKNLSYVKAVFREEPYYRHYASEVKSLLRYITKLKKQFKSES